jgi:hypothetical protein
MAPAQAFIIDDFGSLPPGQGIDPDTGQNYSYQAESTIVSTIVTTNAPPKNKVVGPETWANDMMRGPGDPAGNPNNWDRDISAHLLSGDAAATEICYNCQAAHLTADAGVVASVGEYWFEWTGTSLDLSSYSSLVFDWGADLAGTTWFADFGDGTEVVNTAVQAALPATPGPGSLTHTASVALPTFAGGGAGLTDIVQVSLHFDGVGALDANIDNVRLVPEPSVLALLSVGLLGLSWQRRRRAS